MRGCECVLQFCIGPDSPSAVETSPDDTCLAPKAPLSAWVHSAALVSCPVNRSCQQVQERCVQPRTLTAHSPAPRTQVAHLLTQSTQPKTRCMLDYSSAPRQTTATGVWRRHPHPLDYSCLQSPLPQGPNPPDVSSALVRPAGQPSLLQPAHLPAMITSPGSTGS